MKAEDFKLSQAEHDAQFQKIRADAFQGLTQSSRPIAVFTGGQPGAGKSLVAGQVMKELGHNAARIDADDLRSYHKDYARLMAQGIKNAPDLVHRDAGLWAAALTRDATEQRYNIVIGGTMRDPVSIGKVGERLRNAGYQVEGRVMAVNDLVSTMHVHQRYENQMASQGVGRFATKEQHNVAYNALPASLETLERNRALDTLTLYNRDGAAIYKNELTSDRRQWLDQPAARQAMDIERNREMTQDEKRDLANGWAKVVRQMNARSAPSTEVAGVTKTAKDELKRAAVHGRSRGYEKLFATPEQMRKQPALIGKFAGIVAHQEVSKREQVKGVQSAISKIADRLTARRQEALDAGTSHPALPTKREGPVATTKPVTPRAVVAVPKNRNADKER